ncbi:MAG: hypothetical protein PVJ28_00895 [Acidimicrobiia bacterium]
MEPSKGENHGEDEQVASRSHRIAARGRRDDLERLDMLISEVMSDQAKTMWEGKFWGGSDQQIIGYGEYTYQKSNRETVEWFIVGLAAQQDYISTYVNATDGNQYLTEKYSNKLGKVKAGKSSIGFDTVEDVDLVQLSRLVADAKRVMS